MTVSFDIDVLRTRLVRSGSPWADVEHHETIGSTNARAALLSQPWRVVVAEHQSQGRGRLARAWEAPPGTSLAVSATLPLPATGSAWMPLLAGVAVVEAVEALTSLRTELKWPNDVLLPADGSRKVCGILCEVVSGPGPRGSVVIVGAGVNVSQTREQLPVGTGTSLALAGAGEVDRAGLVAAYLLGLARWYDAPAVDLRAAYRSRCVTVGRRVTLSRPGAVEVLGEAVAVDDEGRLVVDSVRGRTAWAAGDVVHTRTV